MAIYTLEYPSRVANYVGSGIVPDPIREPRRSCSPVSTGPDEL